MNLDKRNVGERLAKSAIRLFLDDFDSIAVHVLASAAAQVFHDICRTKSLSTFSDKLNTQIRPEKRKEFRNLLRTANNYFKHADKDTDLLLERFDARSNEMVIFAALKDHATAFSDEIHEFRVFEAWFTVTHPDFFPAIPTEMKAQIEKLNYLSNVSPEAAKEALRDLL